MEEYAFESSGWGFEPDTSGTSIFSDVVSGVKDLAGTVVDFQKYKDSIDATKADAETKRFIAEVQANASKAIASTNQQTEITRSQIQLAQAQKALQDAKPIVVSSTPTTPGKYDNMMLIIAVVGVGIAILSMPKIK